MGVNEYIKSFFQYVKYRTDKVTDPKRINKYDFMFGVNNWEKIEKNKLEIWIEGVNQVVEYQNFKVKINDNRLLPPGQSIMENPVNFKYSYHDSKFIEINLEQLELEDYIKIFEYNNNLYEIIRSYIPDEIRQEIKDMIDKSLLYPYSRV